MGFLAFPFLNFWGGWYPTGSPTLKPPIKQRLKWAKNGPFPRVVPVPPIQIFEKK